MVTSIQKWQTFVCVKIPKITIGFLILIENTQDSQITLKFWWKFEKHWCLLFFEHGETDPNYFVSFWFPTQKFPNISQSFTSKNVSSNRDATTMFYFWFLPLPLPLSQPHALPWGDRMMKICAYVRAYVCSCVRVCVTEAIFEYTFCASLLSY